MSALIIQDSRFLRSYAKPGYRNFGKHRCLKLSWTPGVVKGTYVSGEDVMNEYSSTHLGMKMHIS